MSPVVHNLSERLVEHVCVWCRDVLTAAERVRCDGCGVGYHRDCAEQLRSCGVLGCAGVTAPPTPPTPTREPVPARASLWEDWLSDVAESRLVALSLATVPTAVVASPVVLLLALEKGSEGLELGGLVALLLVPLLLALVAVLVWTWVRRLLFR